MSRPSPELLERLSRHGSSAVADALGGAGVMDAGIKPIAPGMRCCGPAYTIWTRPGDALYLLKAADRFAAGDVVVVSAGGTPDLACFGDNLASYYQGRGAAGIVVDGAIRDVDGIAGLEFAAFARGSYPAISGASGPGALDVAVDCGGVGLEPGDIVVGDADGVVVVPPDRVREVVEHIERHAEVERGWREQVAAGRTLAEVHGLDAPDEPREPETKERSIVSDTFERTSITSALAQRIVAGAEEKARELGQPFVIAVVDDSGVLKAFSRMDGAPLLSVQVAQDKAYTAVGFGMPTDQWHDFIKDDPPLATGAPAGIDRLVVFGGGYPIAVDGAVVGAIGVSGGHYSQDMEVAQGGLAVLSGA